MILLEYISATGRAEMTDWRLGLENVQRNQLDQMLDRLEDAGPELAAAIMTGPVKDQVYKLQIGGKVRLRPMLCFGPAQPTTHITLLCPATERDFKLKPPGAVDAAVLNRAAIVADASRSRPFERPDDTRWVKTERKKKKSKRKGR